MERRAADVHIQRERAIGEMRSTLTHAHKHQHTPHRMLYLYGCLYALLYAAAAAREWAVPVDFDGNHARPVKS